MKKYYLLFVLITGLLSCTDNSLMDEMPNKNKTDVSLKVRGDGKYESVGYGYDITDVYLGETAVKMQVVDVESFVKADNAHRFHREFIGLTSQREFYGETYIDYLNEIIRKSNYKGSVAYNSTVKAENSEKPNTKDATSTDGASFSGSAAKDNISKHSYSTKYSFGRGDVLKRQAKVTLDATPDKLSNYLSKSFREDLQTLSADLLVVKYGTHVILDITVGGMYVAEYKSAIVHLGSTDSRTKVLESGLKLAYKGVGIDFSTSNSTTETTVLNTKNTDWMCKIECWGGSTNGVSVTVSPTEPPKQTFNYGEWTKSVDDTHSVLVDVNWNATYPIYDFVADPVKKAQITVAMEKYIVDRKLGKILELIPLYRLYNPKSGDVFCTTFYDEAKIHVNLGHYVWDNGYKSMNISPIQGYLLKNQAEGTVPLYRLYNPRSGDVFCTGFYDEAKKHVQSGSAGWDNGHAGMNKTSIQGYIYRNQVAGTIPLYRLYDGKNNSFCLSYYDETKIYVDLGYYGWDNGYAGMNKTPIQGYLYPCLTDSK